MIEGQRWFDHNRLKDPADSYYLDGYQGWRIEDDPSVCRDECSGIEVHEALQPGFVGGTLKEANCPHIVGATSPYTCAIVVEEASGQRVGLLMDYEGDTAAAEVRLECLRGSRVAVRTTGVPEDFKEALLRRLVGPIDRSLRWAGDIGHLSAEVP